MRTGAWIAFWKRSPSRDASEASFTTASKHMASIRPGLVCLSAESITNNNAAGVRMFRVNVPDLGGATTGSSQIAPGTARHCHIRQPGLRTLGVTTTPPGIASPQMSRSPQNPRSFENVPTRHGHACCIAPCMSTHFPVPDAPRPWSYSPF